MRCRVGPATHRLAPVNRHCLSAGNLFQAGLVHRPIQVGQTSGAVFDRTRDSDTTRGDLVDRKRFAILLDYRVQAVKFAIGVSFDRSAIYAAVTGQRDPCIGAANICHKCDLIDIFGHMISP